MPLNFIYLDDEPPAAVRPYVRAVTACVKELNIEHTPPKSYPEQIPFLRECYREGRLDGLILDLRLDQFPDWQDGDTKADYRAATLAQEIRTRATEGNLPEFPIVLWSTDERLKKSYVNDDTSHDLFDLKSLKGMIEEREGACRIGMQLRALVEGYREIQGTKSKYRGRNRGVRLLGFAEAPPFLDERILVHFEGRSGALPTHEAARFLLRQLLETPGPLIDSATLAARLGVDLEKSPGFAGLVTEYFSEAAYAGPFAGGWPRWWSSEVERIWRSMNSTPGALRTTPAEQKVEFLRKYLKGKNIVPANLPEHARSSAFWTVCKATGTPLDPKDGYLIDRQPQYPWQDRIYVSLDALLDGSVRAQGLRIDPLEAERLSRARLRSKAT